MLKKYLLIFGLLYSFQAFGQFDFNAAEAELRLLFEALAKERNDSLKTIRNDAVISKFESILKQENSFQHKFDSLFTLGKLSSSDNLVKVYTWNIHYNSGEFKYFGFIQNYVKKKNQYFLWKLTDNSDKIVSPNTEILSPDSWYGALYYEIIIGKRRKNVHYLLLGWDGNNDYSTKKIIEPLIISSTGKPKFGAPVFVLKKGNFKRIFFEYSKRASMTLKYDKKLSMIVFDHLSPAEPKYKDNYRYYGPDFSFDAFEFKKGKWIYIPDIDARNKNK